MSAHTDRVTAALADHYRIEREIGEGGMATVYRAHDLKHDRDVAIKVVHPDLGAALGGERFLSEIRTTARLQHPHILPLLDSGAADGLLYYVMPLVTGETLRTRLERERQLPIADALRIAREVAGALDHAHRQGVIHRDIKPENILLQDGAAVVADFGIALALQTAGGARMTQTGLSLGTPQYMSPEQAMGERAIDARSDIYALGVVTYEMLAGDPPFTGSTVQALIARVMSERPTSLRTLRDTVPASVDDAVQTALAKLPADRHASAAAFAEALTRVSATTQVSATTTSATKGAPDVVRPRSRVLLAIGSVCALALAAAAGAWWPKSATSATSAIARLTRLTHGSNVGCASIAPNGKQFAAIVGSLDYDTWCSGTLVIRPLPTGPDLVLAEGIRNVNVISWSPDESGVLVSGIPAGKENGVYLYSTRSAAPRLIHAGPTGDEGFIDAKHVYFAPFYARDVLHIADVESGEVRDSLHFLRGSRSAFSPSGNRVVFENDHGRFLADRRGALTDSVLDYSAGFLAWVGDTGIVYSSQDVIYQGVDPRTGKFVGPARVLVANLPAVTRNLSIDREGRRLVLVMDFITDELVVMDLPSAATARTLVRSLNGFLGIARFAPRGDRVAYVREDPLNVNAYTFDLTTGVERSVTNDSSGHVGMWWIDDERLASAGDSSLFVHQLTTARVQKMAWKATLPVLGVAGSTWLFGQGPDTVQILDTLSKKFVTQRRPAGVSAWTYSVVSTDGAKIAFAGLVPSGGRVYHVYDVATRAWSAPTAIDTLKRELLGLTPSGTLYSSTYDLEQGRTAVWRASVGAPFARFATLPVHCEAGTASVSADGTHAVCNRRTHLPDVWTVDLSPTKK